MTWNSITFFFQQWLDKKVQSGDYVQRELAEPDFENQLNRYIHLWRRENELYPEELYVLVVKMATGTWNKSEARDSRQNHQLSPRTSQGHLAPTVNGPRANYHFEASGRKLTDMARNNAGTSTATRHLTADGSRTLNQGSNPSHKSRRTERGTMLPFGKRLQYPFGQSTAGEPG